MLNQNQKKIRMNRTLAIALSLLVVTAIVITVVAVIAGKREKPEDKPPVKPEITDTRPTPTLPPETQKPETPVIVEKPVFVSPVTAGKILNEWSGDLPVFSNTTEDYRLHTGVDIENKAGTPVYAVADGTVELCEMHPLMGQTVVISHAGGFKTVYRNLQTSVPEGIEKGADVRAGDEIGYVGDTALVEISEPPHLHFELYKDDKCENPLNFVSVTPINPDSDYED